MAETQLTNAVIPSIFTGYTFEPSIYKSRFYLSGALEINEGISSLLAGGGETMNLPFWRDVGGSSGDVPSETVAATVNNLFAQRQIFRRQMREKAWGTNDLVKIIAGSNPMDSLANMVVNYWGQAYEQNAINTLVGMFADNSDNDAGDLINDISGAGGAASILSDAAVIDTQAKLGENGTVGRGDLNNGGFAAIVVHPSTYALLRHQNAIDVIPVGDQQRNVEVYMGMVVIVTRNAPEGGGDYVTYIVKNGALQFGQSTVGYTPTEVDRDATKGFGIDALYTRRVFAVHPVGTAWQENTVTDDISPSDANLQLAANWDRVFNAENMRAVMLKHKIA